MSQRLAVTTGYVVLGAALLWSRLFHLGHSFWVDEIVMVDGYVRAGPREILTSSGLNHQLMVLLSWVATTVAGESEIALRLLSAVPFIAGAALVTAWLHGRVGPLSGMLFLFLATVSPLLLDITRQARGYGLAFLAMSVLVIAALEASRTGSIWAVTAMCAAGVLGAWTLPQFAIAFFATAATLLLEKRIRLAVAVGLVLSAVAIYAWYAPHSSAVQSSSQIPDGVQIAFPWVVTAPIDQVLLPALIWIDGTVLVAGFVWVPLVLLALVFIGSSPLLRTRASALIMCSGAVTTTVVLWIGGAYVIPRYVSFLLVPLFMLVATGAAAILQRAARREAAVRTVVCVAVISLLTLRFAALAPDVVALPREANRDAADVIEADPAQLRVLAYVRNPRTLDFYLDRPVRDLRGSDVAAVVCGQDVTVFFVHQPFTLDPVDLPCLERSGVEHHRFAQYARGDETNVWLVPPAA